MTRAAAAPRAPLVYGYRTFGTHSNYADRRRPPIVDHIAACAN